MDKTSRTPVIEVKRGLSAVRGLRDALLKSATEVARRPEARGYVLLVDPKLSRAGIEAETRALMEIVRENVADRMAVIAIREGEPTFKAGRIPAEHLELLRSRGIEAARAGFALPSPDKKSETLIVLMQQWITAQGPMTMRWLSHTVGCNYRTASAVVRRLGPAIERHPDRRIQLQHFPEQEWERLVTTAADTRATLLYTDRSNQPRSAESLVQRLANLERLDIAVGGVIGAKRYFPHLDIEGTPRLDLCVHAPSSSADVDFVRHLDPALERSTNPYRAVRLAVHFVRRREPFFDVENGHPPYSSPVDCLLDLYNARLDMQASSFQRFLQTRGEELSG